jgi:hypothetical protein
MPDLGWGERRLKSGFVSDSRYIQLDGGQVHEGDVREPPWFNRRGAASQKPGA